MARPLISKSYAHATGVGSIGIQITAGAEVHNSIARGASFDLALNASASLYAGNIDYRTVSIGAGATIEALAGDRAAWDTTGYAGRHARDIDEATYTYHLGPGDAAMLHDPVTLGAGSDPALALSGQQLTLADVLTPSEHTSIGNSLPHHAPVTLGAGSDAALALSGQQLTLADVLTPSEHTAIGNSSPHHAPVTLGAGSDAALELSGQQLTLTLPSGTGSLDDLSDVNTAGAALGMVLYNNGGTWVVYQLNLGTSVVMTGDALRFGNVAGGNYLEIDTQSGNLRLLGAASAWDDLRVEPTVRGTGAHAPTYTNYKSGIYAYYFDDAVVGSEKEVNFKMQMPHGWKIGSAIHMHLHWVAVTTGSAGEKIRWGLEYTKANINGVFGATTTIYATDPESPPSTTPTADTHYLTEFAAIDMSGNTLSAILLCRLFRNSSDAADTYTGTAALISIDAHYEIDGFGSDEELVKDTSAALLLESNDYLLLESGDKLLTE